MDRKCLKCDRQFNSAGPSNRICGKCRSNQTPIGEIASRSRQSSVIPASGSRVVKKSAKE